jgi:hypothetical protein
MDVPGRLWGSIHVEVGIHRVSDGKDHFVAWGGVKRVSRHPNAFFIELANGAMPLPYRFISAQDKAVLDEVFANG